jgi:16S rRNA (uracil1498-N3)-methyltransferase
VSLVDWRRRVDALTQLRVADVQRPELSKDDDHHLRRVLRATVGEELVVTDGRGSWSFCEVATIGLNRVSPVVQDPTPTPTTLYLAPLKGDRSEWAIAKATELGITTVVPLLSARLAVKFKGEVRDKNIARWQRIADEACGQCRRTYDLRVTEPLTPVDIPHDVAIADFDGEGDWSGVRAIAIGPEGGWAEGEWDAGRRHLSLGPTVLRAETAAVVASSLLSFTNGSWGFTAQSPANR